MWRVEKHYCSLGVGPRTPERFQSRELFNVIQPKLASLDLTNLPPLKNHVPMIPHLIKLTSPWKGWSTLQVSLGQRSSSQELIDLNLSFAGLEKDGALFRSLLVQAIFNSSAILHRNSSESFSFSAAGFRRFFLVVLPLSFWHSAISFRRSFRLLSSIRFDWVLVIHPPELQNFFKHHQILMQDVFYSCTSQGTSNPHDEFSGCFSSLQIVKQVANY